MYQSASPFIGLCYLVIITIHSLNGRLVIRQMENEKEEKYANGTFGSGEDMLEDCNQLNDGISY